MWFLMSVLLACGVKKAPEVAPVPETSVVPDTELKSKEGPTETSGIEAVEVLGQIDLRTEFEGFDQQTVMRIRRLVVSPEGVVAEHEHQARPGIALIVVGEIVEFRDGGQTVKKTGDYAFEQSGVSHWWENQSSEPVTAIVVDILIPEQHQEIPALLDTPSKTDFPTENQGILNVTVVGTIDLTNEYPALQGRTLRARMIEVDSEGVVGYHEHQSRPGFAYVVEGEMVEYQKNGNTIEHSVGSLSIEQNGLGHWWKNIGDMTAKIFVVDIISEE
jgi:quercetin dioxygenase-like cupin family protein